jgi:3-deoxy-manno-octulosonate cytidylyltransferase (CMP-KDO synthetase)
VLFRSRANAAETVVATDDQRIFDLVEGFGGNACMTANSHRSGTDRILEVAKLRQWGQDSIVVNLQGDEPLMPTANINQVAEVLATADCSMATLHKAIDPGKAQDPNLVKLVHDQLGRALYFSRALIPYDRNGEVTQYFGHIGIYAYRVGFLHSFSQLPPCELEVAESLEQLRALYNGYSIHTQIARAEPGPGVDTEEDLALVETLMSAESK